MKKSVWLTAVLFLLFSLTAVAQAAAAGLSFAATWPQRTAPCCKMLRRMRRRKPQAP